MGAKTVYKPNEISSAASVVTLTPAVFGNAPAEMPQSEGDEAYSGPTVEDLQREAEKWKEEWESEKARMMSDSQAEAEKILSEAKESAASALSQSEVQKAQAEEEAKSAIEEARSEAEKIVGEAREKVDSLFEETRAKAKEEGRKKGYDAGYQEGLEEAKRLAARVQEMVGKVADSRAKVLAEAEQQVIDLVMHIARKVVKTISESQRDVVIENIAETLKKIKRKGDVTIRVNLDDFQIATKRKQEFVEMLESGQNITIVEDSSVDVGGVVVETDFGSFDARIASQLAFLEQKILEASPVRQARKTSPIVGSDATEEEKAAAAVDKAIDG